MLRALEIPANRCCGEMVMRGMAEKAILISVFAVMGAGSATAYNAYAEESGAMTLDELLSLVNWDALASVISGVLGG
jgi:hypothetical protein